MKLKSQYLSSFLFIRWKLPAVQHSGTINAMPRWKMLDWSKYVDSVNNNSGIIAAVKLKTRESSAFIVKFLSKSATNRLMFVALQAEKC